MRKFSRKIIFYSLTIAGLSLSGFLAVRYLRPTPDIVIPLNLERLDPALVALLESKLAEAEAAPRDASAHSELGLVYEANLLWDEARACFENASQLDPAEMNWRLHLAIATRQAGDFEGALKLLRALAKQYPAVPYIQQRLGEALLENGNLSEAGIAFRRLIDLAAEVPHGYIGLGDVLLQQEEAQQAAEVLQKALFLAPGSRRVHYLLGRTYYALGRHEEVERELAKGVDATISYLPDPLTELVQSYAVNLATRLERGKGYLAAGEPQKAVPILEEAAAIHPKNITVLNDLAIAYMRVGRLDEAEKFLSEAKIIDAGRFSTYINLTSWALRANRPEQALEFAEAAVELAPTTDQTYFSHGQALARLGRFEEALTSMQKALQIDSGKAQSHSFTGDLYFKLSRLQEARVHYQKASKIDPGLFPAWLGLARVNSIIGRSAEAIAALTEARRLVPGHPLVLKLAHQFQTTKK